MTDNRKILESTEDAASLDGTPPAPTVPAEQSKSLGGITKTADSALRNAASGGHGEADAVPSSGVGVSRQPASPSKGGQPAASSSPDDAAARADAQTPEDESALESLGRAIGAPLSGEAAEKEPRR